MLDRLFPGERGLGDGDDVVVLRVGRVDQDQLVLAETLRVVLRLALVEAHVKVLLP